MIAVIIPSFKPLAHTNVFQKWRDLGYYVTVGVDGSIAQPISGASEVLALGEWPGIAKAFNRMVENVHATAYVLIGDDIWPDPKFKALALETQFVRHFKGTFGVMNPTGDRFGSWNVACISPWVGYEYCCKVGPCWPEYRAIWVDNEMKEVAERKGVLWNRPDIVQYHDHWTRQRIPIPESNKKNSVWFEHDRLLFVKRQQEHFPGA